MKEVRVRVPIVELDCSGIKMDVGGQLTEIGRLMRHAVQLPPQQQRQDNVNSMAVNGSVGQRTAVNEDMQWMA